MPYFLVFVIFVLLILLFIQHRYYQGLCKQFFPILKRLSVLLQRYVPDENPMAFEESPLRTFQKEVSKLNQFSHSFYSPRFTKTGDFLNALDNLEKWLSRNKTPKEVSIHTEIALSKLSVNDICRQCIFKFYESIVNKGLEVQIDIPEEPIYILGNENALRKILEALILNSMTYGANGLIIGLSLDSDEKYAYIEIWDRGTGADSFHQNSGSERFLFLEDDFDNQNESTRKLIEALGGEISFNSHHSFQLTAFTLKLLKVPSI